MSQDAHVAKHVAPHLQSLSLEQVSVFGSHVLPEEPLLLELDELLVDELPLLEALSQLVTFVPLEPFEHVAGGAVHAVTAVSPLLHFVVLVLHWHWLSPVVWQQIPPDGGVQRFASPETSSPHVHEPSALSSQPLVGLLHEQPP